MKKTIIALRVNWAESRSQTRGSDSLDWRFGSAL